MNAHRIVAARPDRHGHYPVAAAAALLGLLLSVLPVAAQPAGTAVDTTAKDLRTKEQRLYDIQLREAQWKVDAAQLEMDTRQSDYEENRDLFDQRIRTLEELNTSARAYQKARLAFGRAAIALDQTRLSFLREATHVSILQATKFRTPDGHRQAEFVVQNNSDLQQAISLNPKRSADEVRSLLEIQNLRLAIENREGLIIAEPYEVVIASLPLNAQHRLSVRLLDDVDDVVVAMTTLDGQRTTYKIVLRKESLQDIPTINSVQFSQEGDLNSKVRYDLILERLAEDEKTFRLAVVNLPSEISYAFVDPATSASLTQVKFSEEVTRQLLELELQIPEKLSRKFVDQTLSFHVLVTDEDGLARLESQERGPTHAADLDSIPGSREHLELIPRGKGALDILVANRYQEVRTDERASFRAELQNAGTLEVEDAYLVLTVPLGWTCATQPDTVRRIAPGEKEPVTVTLTPPAGLGVSEYDVRLEAHGRVGAERIEAQEKDLTLRLTARANLWRNSLLVAAIVALVVGVAVISIRVSRR